MPKQHKLQCSRRKLPIEEPPSATPRVDAGVTHEEARRHLIAQEGGWYAVVYTYIAQQAELERRVRELSIARNVYRMTSDVGAKHNALRELLIAIDAMAELLETGATKGSSDGKE